MAYSFLVLDRVTAKLELGFCFHQEHRICILNIQYVFQSCTCFLKHPCFLHVAYFALSK